MECVHATYKIHAHICSLRNCWQYLSGLGNIFAQVTQYLVIYLFTVAVSVCVNVILGLLMVYRDNKCLFSFCWSIFTPSTDLRLFRKNRFYGLFTALRNIPAGKTCSGRTLIFQMWKYTFIQILCFSWCSGLKWEKSLSAKTVWQTPQQPSKERYLAWDHPLKMEM